MKRLRRHRKRRCRGRSTQLWRSFWDKQPDGIMIDKKEEVCYVLEFKRVMERYGGEQEKKKGRAELQYKFGGGEGFRYEQTVNGRS